MRVANMARTTKTLGLAILAVVLLAPELSAQRYRGGRTRSVSVGDTSTMRGRTRTATGESSPLGRGSIMRATGVGESTTSRMRSTSRMSAPDDTRTRTTRVRSNAGGDTTNTRTRNRTQAGGEGEGFPRARLTPTGPGQYRTGGGLALTKRSIRSVLSHGRNDSRASRPHGVFSSGRRGALGVVDAAWTRARQGGQGVESRPGRNGGNTRVITVDMGRNIGYVGGNVSGQPATRHVRLVVDGNSLITAYPVRGGNRGRGNRNARSSAPDEATRRRGNGGEVPDNAPSRSRQAEMGNSDQPIQVANMRYARPGSDERNPNRVRERPWTDLQNPRREHPSRTPRITQIASDIAERAGIPSRLARTVAEQVRLGLPSNTGRSNPNDYILPRRDMVISYNRERRVPNWVAWRTTRENIAVSDDQKIRTNDFREDPALPRNWTNPTPRDYQYNGYDRGHIVSSGERQGSTRENSRTYVMTNMMPQTPGNNRGPWRHMEYHVRDLAAAGNEVHIFAGPGFDRGATPRTTGSGVGVPDFTWKVAVVLRPGQTLGQVDANTRVIAIKIPNTNNVDLDVSRYRTSVAEIERATGLQFFTNLRGDVAEALRQRVDTTDLGAAPPPPGS